MATLNAVDVGDLNAAEAPAADRRHLELTLGTEVEVGGDFRAAMRASLLDRLAKQEVNDCANTTGHQ